MNKLDDTLSKRYQTKNIQINITDHKDEKFLTVSFINTPYNNCTDGEKKKMTREIRRIVIVSNKDSLGFESGIVQFITHNNYGIVATNQSESFDMHLYCLPKQTTEK